MITVCPVGAETTREHNPSLPHTPEEIAAEAERCEQAGAALIHVHVRAPDGAPTQDAALFKQAVGLIRERTELITQVSTGGAVGMSFEQRVQSLGAEPEMATLTCGTVNFGDDVFQNPPDYMRRFAEAMLERGVHPEFEIFELGQVANAIALCEQTGLDPAGPYDFVMGVPGAMPGDPALLCEGVRRLPEGARWSATGVGRSHLPITLTALALGGGVRTGLEDVVYYSKGRPAKGSSELIERVARLAEDAGRPAATPGQAREALGLAGARQAA